MMMHANLYESLIQKFPFLSILLYGNTQDEYVGIIQNMDTATTGFYDINLLNSESEKQLFLSLGEKWYFESNRQLPINIYLKQEWNVFSKTLKTFVTKEVYVIQGPATSLSALSQKKKRRAITVIKKL
jgi:hypothetical protein